MLSHLRSIARYGLTRDEFLLRARERLMTQSAPVDEVWTQDHWRTIEIQTSALALKAAREEDAWAVIVRRARSVLRNYSTSFYLVTRFLPKQKREKVEAIYAAVRYPDEVVDTFSLTKGERGAWLDEWTAQYERGLACNSIHEALQQEVPCFLASFTKVVRDAGIPHEHYRAFLQAMRLDSEPRPFATLDDLIDNYIYGSAIVVGYFLTHVYGSVSGKEFVRALDCARNLGIALQLTNFLRDAGEDFKRGRIYLPQDMLRAEGITEPDFDNPKQHRAISAVLRQLVEVAEGYYARSLVDLDAFNPDSRIAIHSCIKVYRRLNDRISTNQFRPRHRESVPVSEKFRILPASKYWRIPLAYLRK
ncbi:MAG: phytoene/squalene synthase family protein [Pyrinomonadaceae bacterium]